MQRFILYGSPHSLPTYKVALMLRMSEEPFAFRYISFQKAEPSLLPVAAKSSSERKTL